jgi:hypothetical protein
MAVVVQQGRDQPVAVVHTAAVGAGDGQFRVDDAYGQSLQVGQEGAVGQVGQHRWPAGGLAAHQEPCSGRVDLGEERGGVEGPVEQNNHVGLEQAQQAPCQGCLVSVGR